MIFKKKKPKASVQLEKLIADLHKNQSTLNRDKKILDLLLNDSDVIIYLADINTHELLYLNKKGVETFGERFGERFGENYKGKKCYDVLQGFSKPCAFCNNHILRKQLNKPYRWTFQNTVTKRIYAITDYAFEITNGKTYLVRLEIAKDITDYIEEAQKKGYING